MDVKKSDLKLAAICALYLSAILSFSLAAFSTEPSLPTSIYGKVLNADGTPASNMDVTLVWIDSNDAKVTSYYKTLTRDQAIDIGDGDFEGFYLFNKGYIKAKPNSEVIILINGLEFEKLASNPGGAIKVKDATLYPKGSPQYNSYTKYTGFQSTQSQDQDNDESLYGGGGSSSDGLSGQEQNYDEGIQSPNYAPISASSSSNDYSGTSANPLLPTNLHGQVLDENNNPVSGEEISAEWTDQNGAQHTEKTKSFSSKESNRLGNKSLNGYFSFNQGNILAKPNSTISLRTKSSNLTVQFKASPGNNLDAGKLKIYPGNSEGSGIRQILNRAINSTSYIFTGGAQKNNKSAALLLILIFLAVLLPVISYFGKRRMQRKKLPIPYSLYRSIVMVLDTKVSEIMTRGVVSVSEDAYLREASEVMVSKNLHTLVVLGDKRAVGVISEDDFLSKIFEMPNDAEVEKLKVKDVMSMKFITAGPNSRISECANLIKKNNLRKILIIKDGDLTGIATATDFLKHFEKFASRNTIDSFSIPLVGSSIGKGIAIIDGNPTASDVCCAMVTQSADYALINGDLIGIITTRDLLEEFYKSPSMMRKLKSAQIMKSPLITITAGEGVFEANRKMIEHGVRRLPVTVNKQFIGVLNQIDLMNSIYSFFWDTRLLVDKAKNSSKPNIKKN